MTSRRPVDWSKATGGELASVRGVCFDIDDTFSTDGKITAGAFSALWRLREGGFALVAITGRPAGWCDHIARFWPVNAVVGENGAFTFYMQDGVRKRLETPGASTGGNVAETRARLQRLGEKIRQRFPHAKWASDQPYREFDLAVDFREDVPAWPREEVDALVELCKAEGAHAKISSIHVNAWFGDYDKRRGMEHWLASGAPGGVNPPRAQAEWLYVGDSPNDEPLFGWFENSVGVANLREFLDRIQSPPRWITRERSGAGFEEVAQRLITFVTKGSA